MGVKTKIVVPIVLIAAAAIAFPQAAEEVGSSIADAFDGIETTGEGDSLVMYGSSAKDKVKNCTAVQMLNTRDCDGLKVVILDAAKMPFIALNTKESWASGNPAILTMARAQTNANRAAACPPSFPKPYGGSCDEHPMAATAEGGKGARAAEVPRRENLCQGGSYGAQYPKDGDQFLLIIWHPDQMATAPFTGADIAKDRGSC